MLFRSNIFIKHFYQLKYQHFFWLSEDCISLHQPVSTCRAGKTPPGIFICHTAVMSPCGHQIPPQSSAIRTFCMYSNADAFSYPRCAGRPVPAGCPPPRQRSAFVAKLMEQALSEDDPLYTSGACCGVGFVLECQNAGVA